MADNIAVTPGTGKTVIADEVTDGTLGTGIVQYVKLMDGAPDATGKYGNSNPLPTATFDAAAPTTVNLTAADVGSTTTTTGFNSASITTGTPTAASFNAIQFNGENAVAIDLSGSWVGTVVFERTINGTTWHPATVSSAGQNYSSVTGNGLFFINAAGAIGARVRATSFTSGPIVSSLYAATGIFPVSIISAVSGMYSATAPTLTDKGVAALQLDASGRLLVNPAALSSANDSVLSVPAPIHPLTSTITSVTGSVTSTTILASNSARKVATVYNESTAILYLALTSNPATTAAYTLQVPAGGYYELVASSTDGVYTGAITGIWSAANGNARITEIN